MDLLHHIDRIEELVANAQRVPIGGQAMVDRQRMLDLIDQIRVAVPNELHEAQQLIEEREALLRNAEEEAQLLVARAEEHVTKLTAQHEIVRAAQVRAEEIAQEAELRAEERLSDLHADLAARVSEAGRFSEQQMAAADRYAQELLSRLDQQLEAFRQSVRAGLDQLEAPPAQLRPAARGRVDETLDTPVGAGDDMSSGNGNGNGNGHGRAHAQERAGAALGTLQAPAAAQPHREPPEHLMAERGVIDDFSMPQLDDEPYAVADPEREAGDDPRAGDPEQRRLGS